MNHFKTFALVVVGLVLVFAVLDFFNLTGFFLYPYSTLTGQNNNLTSALGNTPSTNGG